MRAQNVLHARIGGLIRGNARWIRKHGTMLGVTVSLAVLTAFLLRPPAVEDLSEDNRFQVPGLLADWKKGEVIVLLRHLERCDRVDAPCLEDEENGITSRSVRGGQELGEDFRQLGLDNTDVLNSPMKRTAQTAQVVFGRTGENEHWLYKCDETMPDEALKRKTPGRNLILVTHSSCIEEFGSKLGYSDPTPDYGTSLFFSTQVGRKRLLVLGFLDVADWDRTLGF